MASEDHSAPPPEAGTGPFQSYHDEVDSPNSPSSPQSDPESIKQPKAGSRRPGHGPRRQSSFARSRPGGGPRTPNRVRFNIDDALPANGHADRHESSEGEFAWMMEEDPMGSDDEEERNTSQTNGHNSGSGQRLPLLAGIEAPSVTLALEADFNPEDYLESARPRSGMKSAFMNMANSIMYA
jgi:sodium-coupled neutral amino acid transporter 11